MGLSERELDAPDCRVDVPASDHLWREAAARSGDPDFGLHFAQRLDLDGFHVVGHIASNSRTLGEALERVVAYARLLHDAGRTELEKVGGVWRFFPGCRGLPEPPQRHVAEFSAASAVLIGRMITARPCAPVHVQFEHARPPSTDTHERLFGVTPSFGAVDTHLAFDAATVALPVSPRGPNGVGRYLESYGQQLLTALQPVPDDLEGQVVRALVTGLQTGAVGITPIARRIGMTARTLQRRLAASGTSFADLVQRARRAAAERYLSDGVLPMAEISFLLGFADQSNFHRAFRRWTGVTPGEYRAQARAAGSHPAR